MGGIWFAIMEKTERFALRYDNIEKRLEAIS
jgi:hypothetical protein